MTENIKFLRCVTSGIPLENMESNSQRLSAKKIHVYNNKLLLKSKSYEIYWNVDRRCYDAF